FAELFFFLTQMFVFLKELMNELFLCLNFADEPLNCKYSLLYRQHAIHLLVYQYPHHRQEIQKIFSSLYDVAE
ncbi:hypothetical protein ABEV21_11830, partial [Geobacillus stearothermophilus]|uniref:hypothetical protein n=1 Tax=Geobacillus stearothermophilus TaxID=1422 RepID=UPI003D21AB4C